jgi:putative ABC transport system substrate-binding protein
LQDEAYQRVFTTLSQDRVDAIIVGDQAENLTNRQLIVRLVEKAQLPAIYPYREFAEIGGLMVYTVDRADLVRQAAEEVSQILKGVNPRDIPFYQSAKFALIINLKAAKLLGLTIPASLVLRADEVIE